MSAEQDRARFAQLQSAQSRARTANRQRLSPSLGSKARRLALPALMAMGGGFPSTNPSAEPMTELGNQDDTLTAQDREEALNLREARAENKKTTDQLARSAVLPSSQASNNPMQQTAQLASDQNRARAEQARRNAQEAKQTATNQEASSTPAPPAQIAKVKRTAIRSTQNSLLTGSIVGSPTVFTVVIGGALWTIWKTIEGYKTFTKARLGLLDTILVPWNLRETLTFFVGASVLLFTSLIILGCIGIVGYYLVNKIELLGFLPSIGTNVLQLIWP